MIIYKITNKINGKIYIGQTIREIERRWAQHCSKKEGCLAIYKAIQKYGKENFSIEQIDTASSLEELNKKETEYILSYNSLSPNGYNLNTGSKNKRWSEESKKRMSLSHLGKTLSDQHKENISDAVKKVFEKNPEKLDGSRAALAEIRKKWSEEGYHPKKGKKLSEESRKRISKAKMGEKNPMFGKTISEKQKESIRNGQQKRLENLPMVRCHQTNTIYNNVTDAAKILGLGRSSIYSVLNGFRKSCKGYTFEYIKRGSHES